MLAERGEQGRGRPVEHEHRCRPGGPEPASGHVHPRAAPARAPRRRPRRRRARPRGPGADHAGPPGPTVTADRRPAATADCGRAAPTTDGRAAATAECGRAAPTTDGRAADHRRMRPGRRHHRRAGCFQPPRAGPPWPDGPPPARQGRRSGRAGGVSAGSRAAAGPPAGPRGPASARRAGWAGAARGPAGSGTSPATTPAGRPHTMTGAGGRGGQQVGGQRRRRDAVEHGRASPARPRAGRRRSPPIGAGQRARPGQDGGERRGRRRTMPAVAPTDIHHPTEWTSSGSISSSPATHSDSSRTRRGRSAERRRR